jgi:Putative beta-barrel porin-2, OmpL-like. bbp2
MGREVMIVLLFVVCVASLLFFAVFLFQISRPRRTPRKEPVVRKVSTSEAVEPAAGRKWLIHLEQQMAEFLLQNKTTAILLVALAISSASLVAQDQGIASPDSDVQKPQQMAQQEPVNAPATQTGDQQTAGQSSPPAPSPLPTPAITGPLQAAPPITFEGGPFGKLNLDGVVSGIGLWQGNHVPGDNTTQAALSNGQVFIQKTTSWWQFYVQAGAYDILALGTPFLSTQKVISDLYGPVPVAYVKLVPTKTTSVLIGALPTLMGAEYTFDFQNMNIERGLLWNQENAINRGVQVNQTFGKFTASLSWNDGYYSNRYSWLSGSLTYANGPHSLSFIGMGNLGQTAFQTLATPVQNNSTMYAAIYTYAKGNWIVQPYFQYSNVPTNPSVGVLHGASTWGGAVLASHTFKHGFSLAGRGEYITSTGNLAEQSVNLLYGPGSGGWSITLTPTYQYQCFFTRADFSWVQATSFAPGNAFGSTGTNANQPRGVIEVGFLF